MSRFTDCLLQIFVFVFVTPLMWIMNALERWRHFWWYRRTPAQPRSAFTTAVLENDVAFVKAALESGMDANTRLPDTREKGAFDVTEEGRKEFPASHQAYIPTALMVATAHGHIAMAKLLLEFGADLRLRKGDEATGMTALHAAAGKGRAEMVAFLLRWSQERSIDGIGIETALLHVEGEEVVTLLLAYGAEVNRKESEISSAWVEGTFPTEESPATVRTVVNREDRGTTPLIEAVYSGQEGVVTLLLANGADVNLKGMDGETALMAAASCDEPQIARLLLTAGAEIDARDDEGRTALWWAKKPKVRAILKAMGATK